MKRVHVRAVMAAGVAAVCAGMLLPAQSASAAPSGPALTFATFNVCKSECDAPAPTWDVRRDRVALVVNESGADVVALNEATNWAVAGTKTVTTSRGNSRTAQMTQWDDIQQLTAPAGYVAPVEKNGPCTNLGCVHTARLLFKQGSVSQMPDFGDQPSAGDSMLQDVAGPGALIGANRQMAWAYLQGANSAGPFLAVSVHLDTTKSPLGEESRVAFAKGFNTWVAQMNTARGLPADFPTVLLGDLNSYDVRQPNGAQAILRKAGWKDAWNAPDRKNIDINSVNYSQTSRSGWPAKPIRNPSGVASRIDYVLYRGAGLKATSYEVVVHLTGSGAFDEAYRASDHNLVRATIAF